MARSLPEMIERHRAARLAYVEASNAHGFQCGGTASFGVVGRIADEALKVEREAWNTLVTTMPATVAELSALAEHLRLVVMDDEVGEEPNEARSPTSEAFEALHSAAVAVAFQAAHEGAL